MYAFRLNTELVPVFQSTGTLVPSGILAESGQNVPPRSTQTSPPRWSHFPLQRHGFDERKYRTPESLFARGWTRLPFKGFSRINKIKEKIFYFYSLSVNYNNRSPTIGSDSIAIGGPP
jgi:hypothetical protein